MPNRPMQRSSGIQILFRRQDAYELMDEIAVAYPQARFLEPHWRGAEAGNLRVPYITELDDVLAPSAMVWLEPPGWEPIWNEQPDKYGRYQIRNARMSRIFLYFGGIYPTHYLEGQTSSVWWQYDREHERFVKDVWKMIKKRSARQLIPLGPDMRAAGASFMDTIWIGREMLRWLGEDPTRYMYRGLERPAPQAYRRVGLPVPADPAFETLAQYEPRALDAPRRRKASSE